MTPSDNLTLKVAEWREKARQGTLTKEEMAEAIKFLRAERTAGVAAASKARKKSSATSTVSADSLFSELDGL